MISRCIKSYTHGPISAPVRRRKITGDARGYATSSGQAIHPDSKAWLQGTVKANPTALRIHQ